MDIAGFDWDKGNLAKCQKHGVSVVEIEWIVRHPALILPDALHSKNEQRFFGVGQTKTGRSVFLIFTFRERGGKRFIRPISARYMHRKEVRIYEKEISDT